MKEINQVIMQLIFVRWLTEVLKKVGQYRLGSQHVYKTHDFVKIMSCIFWLYFIRIYSIDLLTYYKQYISLPLILFFWHIRFLQFLYILAITGMILKNRDKYHFISTLRYARRLAI